MGSRLTPLKERMESMIVYSESGCWEWQGTKNSLGYGIVTFQRGPGPENRTSTTAHRKYWELCNGPLLPRMQVNHVCDNRVCINPEHMFIGDQKSNIQDMIAKGRDNFRGKGPRRFRRPLP